MAAEKICFKDYVDCKDDKNLSKTRKKGNRKRKDNSSKNVYGWAGYSSPPNISGAPAGGVSGADGGGGGGGVGESYNLADVDGNHTQLKNVYNYGKKNNMRFRNYLEDNEDWDNDIGQMVGDKDPDYEEYNGLDRDEDDKFDEDDDDKFDKDIYDLIKELEEEGLSVEDIADETDLSVEEIEDYLEHFNVQDEYDGEPRQGYGEEGDYPDDDMDDGEEEDEEERFNLDKALERSRFATRGRKLGPEQEDEVEDYHTRMRKERGGLRGGGFNPEDEEEEEEEDRDYAGVMDAMDKRRRETRDDEYTDQSMRDGEMGFPDYREARAWSRERPDHDRDDPWNAPDEYDTEPEDEEATRADDEMDDGEFERRYDVERDEMDDESEYDDEPEYADEVQAGDWTIRRIDQDDDFAEDSYDEQDRDEYDRGEEGYDEEGSDEYDRGEEGSDEEDYEYAEDAEEPSKKDQARALYRAMKSGEYTRKDIISAFEKRLQLSPSSSTAYYERIAKEYGETAQQGDQDPMDMAGHGGSQMGAMGMMGHEGMQGEEEPDYRDTQEWDDPHRQGVIRTVKNAHLVFKRQDDDGSFEELWIYKEGDKFQNELEIRRDVIAGTDIPVNKTVSPDGSQKTDTWAVGDVQYLNITGLPN